MWRWWRGSLPDLGPLGRRKFHPCYWFPSSPSCVCSSAPTDASREARDSAAIGVSRLFAHRSSH
eukprot:scaffold96440_cov43-Attheya_sp.AAC.1